MPETEGKVTCPGNINAPILKAAIYSGTIVNGLLISVAQKPATIFPRQSTHAASAPSICKGPGIRQQNSPNASPLASGSRVKLKISCLSAQGLILLSPGPFIIVKTRGSRLRNHCLKRLLLFFMLLLILGQSDFGTNGAFPLWAFST